MSHALISRNSDLKKLLDEGYEVEVRGSHLIVHGVPYVKSNAQIGYGKLISPLALNGDRTIKPHNHVINFMGEYPCNKDGSIITAIRHQQLRQNLFPDIVLNFSFSNKPPGGYPDFYEKMKRYIDIIGAPAQSIDSSVTAKTFKVIACAEDESTFMYRETNSSRACLDDLNSVFGGLKVGIVGCGGTGSYILDCISKTPVSEIHLFDGDLFLQHNAFRAPGAASIDTLNLKKFKVDYFSSIYSQMHRGVIPHSVYLDEDNIGLLKGLHHIFICVDRNSVRRLVIDYVTSYTGVFYDVGLGVNRADDGLIGMMRVTVGSEDKFDHLSNRIGATDDADDDEYASNIQIAELNMLNAGFAIIKWKKLCGFYQDLKQEHHSTYTINTSQLINEDTLV